MSLELEDPKGISVIADSFISSPEYQSFMEVVATGMQEVSRATSLFNKSQSQFMDSMLTVSHITPIRNLRQILAEIKKIKLALGEAYFGIKKKELDIRDQRELIAGSISQSAKDRATLEIAELEWQISETKAYVEGAIRKWANYTLQYQAIQEKHHLENFTEEDFENEEERYHICKAFEQALNAARAHGGIIDEGNQIYLSQIGINGTVAQIEISNYLNSEAFMLSPVDNQNRRKVIEEPTHEMQIEFLLRMAEKFKGCSRKFATWKGMATMQVDALL